MAKEKKTLTILGSTGSIGAQALEVIDGMSNRFEIAYLTANKNIELLEKQIEKYKPKGVAVSNESSWKKLKREIKSDVKILKGKEGIIEAAGSEENDLVLSALVGFSGVQPTLAAIDSKTTVALANKETLVSAGSIITKAAKEKGTEIIAVDSEHSAILQCIVGENVEEIEKIILTASGGPFFETPKKEFKNLTVGQALKHPNWEMGSKITIDSATMMNKGFEVIEAYWLFGLNPNQIDVLIHPQSIVHSLVQFIDGSVKAQLGLPDMRVPISYALTYPERLKFDFPKLDLTELHSLTFKKPDYEKFPCLKLAFETLDTGGSAPAILNAANEIAVFSLLEEKIKFVDIPKCIGAALENVEIISNPSLQEIIETDVGTREFTKQFVKNNLN